MGTIPVITPLQRAIEHLGGPKKAAARLGVTPQALWQWGNDGIPEPRAWQLAGICAEVVAIEDFRPYLRRAAG